MNRLSNYISGMKFTRQMLAHARIMNQEGKDKIAMRSLIDAFDAFVSATNCVISIQSGKKPKKVRS